MSDNIETIRHSISHVLAQAVKSFHPKVKLGIGPAIEDGFYYDFDNLKITEEDLKKIEDKMREIIKKNIGIKKVLLTKKEAEKRLAGQKYKLELLKSLKDKRITFYEQDDFIDLCKGPHVKSTKDIPIDAFKLTHLAGAYWKGDSKNKMLTRIYGVAFNTKHELDNYLKMKEEAEKRNHIKLGKELEIFMISDLVGKGLPIWLPKGNIIKEEIEKLAKEMEKKAGFIRVTTPHLAKKELYMMSGHLPYYENSMYPSMKMDDGTYYLKAMNCPHHHLIYKNKLRSYRDLPLRIAEYGTVYRNELSGTLAGLLRVRAMSMNDAHIYCRKDQIEEEFTNIIKMIKEYYKLFDLKDYWFRLSRWDPKHKEKYIDEPANWKMSEEILRNVLKKLNVKFIEAEDEAAFYGPKIDIQFKAVSGREETMSTIQLDFAAKKRFDLSYQDSSGGENKDVFVIHRAPLSTHERFIAILIENYAGKFPVWLSPVQVIIMPIADRHLEYSKDIEKKLLDDDVRVEVDSRSESISKKVRDAQVQKIPIMITVGDKELENKTLAKY
ncbi:threonine--tRNA ligase [Candidatus Woesearchaeota archaeon]|nr:threonine--tRNA ligase [Candidatus Woesearchaeota archaeon]